MMRQLAGTLIIVLAMTAAGIYVGRITAPEGSTSTTEDHEAAGNEKKATDFSREALANMGVTVGRLEVGSFVRRLEVLGHVSDGPQNYHNLTAGLGGQVTEILAQPGMRMKSGAAILRYVRDPLPRPAIELTAELLSPKREGTHQRMAELRRTHEEVSIYETELARIALLNDASDGRLPVVPRQTVIDLTYQLMRAKRAFEQAAMELEEHGYTEEEIKSAASGGSLSNLGREGWLRALEHNGLWTEMAAKLYMSLPESLRTDRWIIATVAEITAGGFVSQELISFFENNKDAALQFMDCATLIQRGTSLADLRLIHSQGGLEPVVTVRAPSLDKSASWDLIEISLKPGDHVEKGQRIAMLADYRQLRLRIDPVGSEEATALKAMQEGLPCQARPLIAETGPELQNLKLVQALHHDDEEGSSLWLEVLNSDLFDSGEGNNNFRTWSLRPSLRYLVGIPQSVISEAYVLPVTAIAKQGNDHFVFIENGDSFRPVPVVIAARDANQIVIATDSGTALFPGDPVVMTGAYAISVALSNGAANIDPHAGHNH